MSYGYKDGRLETARRKGFKQGIEAAASFIGRWDAQIAHSHAMEDIVLAKFNLIGKRKIRRKRVIVERKS